jgi:hypothetical protein
VTALLFTLAVFLAWWLIGLAFLALVRANVRSLRVALTAPALGSGVTVIPAFILSHAGLSMDSGAVPLAGVLLVASIVVLAIRRPRVAGGVIPVLGLCVVGLLLAGWPMLSLGFRWLANGNEDMSSYVQEAVQLMHHGLLAQLDVAGLNRGADYVTTSLTFLLWGQRPGSVITLAMLARLTGRTAYEVYMPLNLALSLTAACGAGALALTVARHWWAALIAVTLALVSPLSTFAVMQQLLPQVWGLAAVLALLALLMRVELHKGSGATLGEILPIGLLATTTVLVYVEILPELLAAYGLYLVVVALRRELDLRAAMRLWIPVIVLAVVLLNSYLVREVGFLLDQVHHGVSATRPLLFGFIFVPSALPGVLGLQTLPPLAGAPLLDISIVVAAALLLAALLGCGISMRRASPPAVVLVVLAGLAALLAMGGSDFGLFKITMYMQPFLAAAIAVWCSNAKRRAAQALVAGALTAFVILQLSTQRVYVRESRDSVDVPGASSAQLLPAFSQMIASHPGTTVSVTENPFLIELEAARAYGQPLYFIGRDLFGGLFPAYALHTSGYRRQQIELETRLYPWRTRSFDLHTGDASDEFEEDTLASSTLASGRCRLVIPSGQTLTLNRLALPASMPALIDMPCSAAHDLLAFTQSDLGESFYLPVHRQAVSFSQLQADPYVPGQTMAGFGRYALFQVLGPSAGMRLELDLTTTLNHDGANQLSPAAVVGASRTPLPLEGHGSARVFSAPLTPQTIAGGSYVLLDMGAAPREPSVPRSGLQALYGRSIPLDIRFLTSYVRDVSLVSAQQYAQLRPPAALQRFPSDLTNPNLQYSGLYEDGWMGANAYVVLAGGSASDLVIRGEVPAGAGKHLEVLVNGRTVFSKPIAAGALNMRISVQASSVSRRVELRFGATVHLAAPDLRPAAAHLDFLGFVGRSGT